MTYSIISFGKHYGLSLPQVIFINPDYLFWGIDKRVFKGSLLWEATELLKKMRRVRIPDHAGQNLRADHTLWEGHFAGLHIVPKEQPCQYPLCDVTQLPYIDLGFVHERAPQDKRGKQVLVFTCLADLATRNPYFNPRPVEKTALLKLLSDAFAGRRPD